MINNMFSLIEYIKILPMDYYTRMSRVLLDELITESGSKGFQITKP